MALIVAMARNRVIGAANRIPWHLPDELALFKRLTMGGHIIMGRKTFESIGRLLPGRTTIILTRQAEYVVPGAIVAHSLGDAITAAAEGDRGAFVIGGAEIFREALPIADILHLTIVEAEPEGDTWMPDIDFSGWQQEASAHHPADERHPHAYWYQRFTRSTE